MKTQRNEPRISVQNIYFKYSSSSKKGGHPVYEAERFFAHRWNFGRCYGYPRIIKVDENDFPPLLLLSSSVYHVFLSINAPRNKFLPRLTRHLEANDFPFPVKHSVAFPFDPPLLVLILPLSLCMYVRIHILPHLFANRWRQTESIPNGFFSLQLLRCFIFFWNDIISNLRFILTLLEKRTRWIVEVSSLVSYIGWIEVK